MTQLKLKKSSKNMYDYIDEKELQNIINSLEWYFKNDQRTSTDGTLQFIESFYGSVQTFGATDYNDHRKDTPSQLKKLIKESLLRGTQRGHYYDSEGQSVKKIIASGYYGGYSARFIYPSGRTAFNREANKEDK